MNESIEKELSKVITGFEAQFKDQIELRKNLEHRDSIIDVAKELYIGELGRFNLSEIANYKCEEKQKQFESTLHNLSTLCIGAAFHFRNIIVLCDQEKKYERLEPLGTR